MATEIWFAHVNRPRHTHNSLREAKAGKVYRFAGFFFAEVVLELSRFVFLQKKCSMSPLTELFFDLPLQNILFIFCFF